MALKNLSAICAPLCSIISIFFFGFEFVHSFCFAFFSFFFEYFEWCSSNPVCNHEIIDKLDFILIFSTTHTPQKKKEINEKFAKYGTNIQNLQALNFFLFVRSFSIELIEMIVCLSK